MRRNGRLFIILGVGLATLAVALAFLMFSGANQSNPVQQPPPQVKTLVAAQDVPPHTILRDTMLTEQSVDRDLVKADEILTKADVLGKASKTGLVKGQRVSRTDLEVASLANDIGKGFRAIAVPLDQLNAVAGMMREENYVDVIFSVKVSLLYVLPSRPLELDTSTAGDKEKATLPTTPPNDPAPYAYPGEPGSRFKVQGADSKADPTAKVVLQDVRVLRIVPGVPPAQPAQPGQPPPQAQTGPPPPDMVVLEVTDEQAELIKFILDNGASFTFVLRAKDDHDKVTTSGITFDLLLTNYQLPAPKSVRLPGDKLP